MWAFLIYNELCLYDKSPTLSSLAFSYCTFHLNSWLYSWAHGSRSFMCDQRWSCFRLICKKMNDLLNTWLNNLWNDFYKSFKVFYFLTAQNSLVPNFSCLLRTEGYRRILGERYIPDKRLTVYILLQFKLHTIYKTYEVPKVV